MCILPTELSSTTAEKGGENYVFIGSDQKKPFADVPLKNVFLKILQYAPENTCVGVSL